MAFLVSPGVQVNEVDLTNVVPAVATSIGAIGGPFEKGPVSSVTNISSEEELVKVFGKPNDNNFECCPTTANSFHIYRGLLLFVDTSIDQKQNIIALYLVLYAVLQIYQNHMFHLYIS